MLKLHVNLNVFDKSTTEHIQYDISVHYFLINLSAAKIQNSNSGNVIVYLLLTYAFTHSKIIVSEKL